MWSIQIESCTGQWFTVGNYGSRSTAYRFLSARRTYSDATYRVIRTY